MTTQQPVALSDQWTWNASLKQTPWLPARTPADERVTIPTPLSTSMASQPIDRQAKPNGEAGLCVPASLICTQLRTHHCQHRHSLQQSAAVSAAVSATNSLAHSLAHTHEHIVCICSHPPPNPMERKRGMNQRMREQKRKGQRVQR